MKGIQETLAAHPFLAGLDSALLTKIAKVAKASSFRPGQGILKEGGPATASFLLLAGRVALEIHSPGKGSRVIGSAGAGDVVGWSWIARNGRWHFDARAVDSVRAIELDGKALAKACEKDHDLGYELLKRFLVIVTARLEAVRLQLVDVYGRGEAELPWA
jgi:CRP-like cAMP-binding protein